MKDKGHHMDRIFWGICCLVGAVLLIGSEIWEEWADFSLVTVFLTIVFIWGLFKGILNRSYGGILFSAVLLFYLYAHELELDVELVTLLGAALLGTIGLNIIFPRSDRRNKQHIHQMHMDPPPMHGKGGSFREDTVRTTDTSQGEMIYFKQSFGSAIKYVNSENFSMAHLAVSFGEMKVYFDNAIIRRGQAQVKLEVAFGNAILYVPRTWKVVEDASVPFSYLRIKNPDFCQYEEGNPVLYLTGEVSFGGTEVYYI